MPHSQLAWLAWLSRSSLLPVRSFVPDIPTVTATDSISHCKPLLHESPRCTAPWRPWNPWTRVAKTPAVRWVCPRDCRNTFPHDPNFKHQTSCVVNTIGIHEQLIFGTFPSFRYVSFDLVFLSSTFASAGAATGVSAGGDSCTSWAWAFQLQNQKKNEWNWQLRRLLSGFFRTFYLHCP